MNSIRPLACLSLMLIGGCGPATPPDSPTTVQAGAQSRMMSPAARHLLDGGGSEADVLAARAFVVPHTRTDQSICFRAAELGGARLAATEPAEAHRLARVVIAVDGSGSMAGRVGSRTKLDLAREATLSFVDGLPDSVPASLVVFGQQGDNSAGGKAKSCSSIDVLAPMSADRAGLRAAVGKVRAVGWTPLAGGLRAALDQLGASSVPGEQVIYVVSDGIETCGGDPVASAREINGGSARAIVNIIGFGLPSGEAAALQSVARAGGGSFVNIDGDDGYQRAMAGFRETMRLTNNLVSARRANAGNQIATGAKTTEAVQCTGNIIYAETQAALADYDARSARGEVLPPRYQIVALMKEHHDLLVARREAHTRRLGETRDTANAAVEAARKAAQ